MVVGSGGREHALVWALSRSTPRPEIHAAPGNGGMAELARLVPINADDIPGLVSYASAERIALTVIGPEVPIALGLADALQARGLRAFGPSAAAAQLESSKGFAKAFMRANGIPTADYAVFHNFDAALTHLETHPAPIVVKANGLASGKGAVVCKSNDEARAALRLIMQERTYGAAGDEVVIEQYLRGQEVSVLAFCDGQHLAPMVAAQDHKAVYDDDQGPNTGGMGCYAPVQWMNAPLMQSVMQRVLQPTVDAMRRAGTPYVGVLYAGLMVNRDDYAVLEFNCRFGDPEAQVILPLLDSDLLTVMEACVDGRLGQVDLRWSKGACVCVVMASAGYPGRYRSGHEIGGLAQASSLANTVVFHAGTRRDGDRVLTAGGRVLGVSAKGTTLREAIDRAYRGVACVHWPGAMFRHDIGAKGLS